MHTPQVAALIRAALTRTALLSSLLILTACGQKGPLYLPQDPNANPEEVSSDEAPAPAATEKDKPKGPTPADNLD